MKVKKIPMRKCVGSGVLKPKNELLRIVALPSGEIELDITGKNLDAVYIFVMILNALRRLMNPMLLKNH